MKEDTAVFKKVDNDVYSQRSMLGNVFNNSNLSLNIPIFRTIFMGIHPEQEKVS